jgi:D-aminopeptidase
MVPNKHLNPMFVATAEAVEEAIINAVVAAETMTGWQGRTAYGLPVEELVEIMSRYPSVAGQHVPRAPQHQ